MNLELDNLINENEIIAATVTDILSKTDKEINIKISLPISTKINAPVLISIPNTITVSCGDDIFIPNAEVKRFLINDSERQKKVYKLKMKKNNLNDENVSWNEVKKKLFRLIMSGVQDIYISNDIAVIHRKSSPKPIIPQKIKFLNKEDKTAITNDRISNGTGQPERTLHWMKTRFQELEGMMGDTHLTTPLRPIKLEIKKDFTTEENEKIINKMLDLSMIDSRKLLKENDHDILIPSFYFGLNKDRKQVASTIAEIRRGGQKSITPNGLEKNVLSPRYVQFSSVKDNPIEFWHQANKAIGKYFLPSKFMSSEGCTRFLTLHELGHSIQRGFGIKPSYIETKRDHDGKILRYKSQTFDIDRHREEIFADCFAIISLIIDFNDRNTPWLVRQLRATQMFNSENNLQTVYYMTSPAIAEAINKTEELLKTTKQGQPISMYEIGNMAANLAEKWCDNLQEPMNDFFEENDTKSILPRKTAWQSFLKKSSWDKSLNPHFKEFKEALSNLYGSDDLNKKDNMIKFQKELINLTEDIKNYSIENSLPVGEKTFWLLISTRIPDNCSQEVKEKIQSILQKSFIEGVEYTKQNNFPFHQVSGWVVPSSEAFSKPAPIPIIPKTKHELENKKIILSSFKENILLISQHMNIVNDISPNLYNGKKKNGFELTEMNRKFNQSTHYIMALASDLYMTLERAEELDMTYSDVMNDKSMVELYEMLPILIDLRAVMGNIENNTEGRKLRIKFSNIFNEVVQKAQKTIQESDCIFVSGELNNIHTTEIKETRTMPPTLNSFSL